MQGERGNMATRWGICGAGNISHDFCVALKTLPHQDHQIVAVAARSLESAKKFAKTHGIPDAYGSYHELIKNPNIDVVYVGVVHTHHLPVSRLFLNAGKNVLCEKPFAMNRREVMQLVSAARENNVFLMEAVWSRCFPVYAEVDRLLSENTVGEVKMVKVYFGLPLLDRTRATHRELGGGALLDIGVYCLQFALMVFKGERPESIHATGVLLPSGVDESMVVVLKFSGNRMAVCSCTLACMLPNDATICGTRGTIRVVRPMHCPTTLEVNGKKTEFPLPEPTLPLNFENSTGLRYEAEEVRRCLLKGLKESIKMSLKDSELLAEIMDEARRQVVAVAARDLKHAQEFAQKHSIPRAYGSYKELAKDPEIDVVYVGTIHPHHLSVGVLFMNAKKNILCEKPLAMNLKEVQELTATAKKNDVFLMEAIWTRFFPVSMEISRLLSQKEVGEVKVVRVDFGVPLMHVARAVQKELGGGALLDIGVYCLQFVLMVFNGEKPERVQATGFCLDTGLP